MKSVTSKQPVSNSLGESPSKPQTMRSRRYEKKTTKPTLRRQNALWYQTMHNDRFRQFVKFKHTKNSLLKMAESQEEETGLAKGEEENLVFSKVFTWKMISWVSKARASLKLRRFRLIQEQLRKDLEEHLLVETKEGISLDPASDFVMMSARKVSPPKRDPYVLAHLGKSVLNEVNPKLYSVENLYDRERLANNHQIIFHIVNWWLHMKKIPKSTKHDRFGEVSEKHYKQMLTCIYRILVPDGDDEHKASTVEKDWIEDSNGRSSVGIESFVRSIFSLADIWTNSTEMEEYIEFLLCLQSMVCHECDMLNWDFIGSFESYIYDEEDEDLQAFLELLAKRKEEASRAKLEDDQSTIKKKKIRSFKTLSMEQVETQLKNLPSLREYFGHMLKVKKNTLRNERDEVKRLRAIFQSFDPNGDGYLCAKELQNAIRLCRGHHLHIQVVKKLIEEGDGNSDGRISLDEFLHLMIGGGDAGEEPETLEQPQNFAVSRVPRVEESERSALNVSTFDMFTGGMK